MSSAEWILYLTTLVLYGTTSVLLVAKRCSPAAYKRLLGAILLVEGGFVGLRWYLTGHPPILGTYEETLAASLALVLFCFLLDKERKLGPFVVPFAFITLLYGLAYETEGRPLIISEQSLWVYFHALFAWIAYGFYTLAFVAAAAVVAPGRVGRLMGGVAETFKEGGQGGDKVSRWLLYGFSAQTVMFVLGSYYSSRLHGSWWVWDPVEFLFLTSWLIYAVAVHGRFFFGWQISKWGRYVVLGYVVTLVLYWGLVFFYWSTYHVFDPELKFH